MVKTQSQQQEHAATWAKLYDGTWGICLPQGHPARDAPQGTQVEVHKRNGESSSAYLGEFVETKYYGALYRVSAKNNTERKWTYEEVEDYIADMDLEYKYATRSEIWDAVRRLNAGGDL